MMDVDAIDAHIKEERRRCLRLVHGVFRVITQLLIAAGQRGAGLAVAQMGDDLERAINEPEWPETRK